MTAHDPKNVIHHGKSEEDELVIMVHFRKRVKLKGDYDTASHEINKRAARFISLILKGATSETHNQLSLAIEWRCEIRYSQLSAQGIDTSPAALNTWSEWVQSMAATFVSPNLMAS